MEARLEDACVPPQQLCLGVPGEGAAGAVDPEDLPLSVGDDDTAGSSLQGGALQAEALGGLVLLGRLAPLGQLRFQAPEKAQECEPQAKCWDHGILRELSHLGTTA